MAQPVEALAIREVEVHGRDRDPPSGDRGEVGARLVLERGLEAVDLVAAPAVAVLVDQLQLVVVEALAEPRDLDPLRLPGGAVDVQQRLRRQRIGDRAAGPARRPARAATAKSNRRAGRKPISPAPDCCEIAIAGMPEDDALERRRDGSRVGDVVAEVGAVVDARRRSGRGARRPARGRRSERSRPGVPSVA